MNNQKTSKKVIFISLLFITSALIMLSGGYFTIYSIVNDINLMVLNSTVPGAIFGLLVFYLGLRYFFMVKKLKVEVYKKSSVFSWNNFKNNVKAKK